MSLVSPGQKLNIPAAIWNELTGMLGRWTRSRFNQLADELKSVYPPSVVWVKNTTASNLTAFSVLGIGDPVITPTDNLEHFKAEISFEGTTPSTSTPHYGQYAVLQEPCAAGGMARAVVAGVTAVKLNITHAADKYCEIANNVSTSLLTGPLGTSRILWKSTGTGSTDKWGLIRVGDTSGQILVKNLTGSPIAANGGTGTATVHSGVTGSTTGQTLTVTNRTSVAWADTKFGSCEAIDGTGHVSPLQT